MICDISSFQQVEELLSTINNNKVNNKVYGYCCNVATFDFKQASARKLFHGNCCSVFTADLEMGICEIGLKICVEF